MVSIEFCISFISVKILVSSPLAYCRSHRTASSLALHSLSFTQQPEASLKMNVRSCPSFAHNLPRLPTYLKIQTRVLTMAPKALRDSELFSFPFSFLFLSLIIQLLLHWPPCCSSCLSGFSTLGSSLCLKPSFPRCPHGLSSHPLPVLSKCYLLNKAFVITLLKI